MFGSASTAPQLETKFLASLAPPMLACALPGKWIFHPGASLAQSPLFEKFSLQRNFQGLLSIVQLSRFLSFFSCDSFDILSNLFRFVKNFFIFFCLSFLLSSRSASSDSLYRLSHRRAVVNHFFKLFPAPGRSLPQDLLPPIVPPPRHRPGVCSCFCPRHQRQVLSYHHRKELSMFF